MSRPLTQVRELAAWELDNYPYRHHVSAHAAVQRAHAFIAQRSPFLQSIPVLESEALHDLFSREARRPDLLSEMTGLKWSLGLVDLRTLIAFQRRLVFPAEFTVPSIPAADDWAALFALCFGAPKPLVYQTVHDPTAQTLVLTSSNPDLHLRVETDSACLLTLHAGSPFFEVASFRDRWFLRDGYHRAYALLQAQVFAVPAVVVHACTIEELGANQPWFFPETVLFSARPPLVTDFLNQDLVLEYERPALCKTFRITIEEDLQPATLLGDPS